MKRNWEGAGRDHLLKAKLYVPPLRPTLVPRFHLVSKLAAAQPARLILVSAPAGYGKTTLVAGWLNSPAGADRPRAAWLSLDETDNHLGRFWQYVIAALHAICPHAGEQLLPILSRPELPPAESWLPALLNDLADMPAPALLVLDDYHAIHSRAIHRSVNYLIHHLPSRLTVALLTRADPPLQLARLRVQDELLEIRAAELRFTGSEVEQYLNHVLALELPAEDIRRLESRTEGWPAGLYLAGRSLLGYPPEERGRFIRLFSGSDRAILAYLLEEVLQQQPAEICDFLLQTSVLPRLCGPLCAAVSGKTPEAAAKILARLAHDHLFINPLDDRGEFYRYHPLFAESLAARLRDQDVALWHKVHRLAGDWSVANGYPENAVRHAICGTDYERAADLIETVSEDMWIAGNIAILQEWLAALPGSLVAGRYTLRLLQAWIHNLSNRRDEAAALWEETGRLLDALPAGQGDPLRGRWAAMGAAMSHYRTDPAAMNRLARQALAKLPPEDHVWRSVCQFALGLAYQLQGQAGPAATVFRTTAERCIEGNQTYLAAASLCHLIEALFAQGRLHAAQAASERLRDLEIESADGTVAGLANSKIGFGRLAYERNELPAAARLLNEALSQMFPGGQPRMIFIGRVYLARTYEAMGDRAASRRQLELAGEMLRPLNLPAELHYVNACLARLSLYDGRLDDVYSWREGCGLPAAGPVDFRRDWEHGVLAEVWLAEGQPARADELLASLRVTAERQGRAGSDIALSLLHGVALSAQRRWPEADAAVGHALSLGRTQGFVRTFLDVGPPLRALLARPSVRQYAPGYVDMLEAAFAAEPDRNGEAGSNGHFADGFTSHLNGLMLEQLTPRECEILTLIARGASNQEIADELFLSVGTVKGHVNHIFGKLDVHNRTAAVARAREFHLINS